MNDGQNISQISFEKQISLEVDTKQVNKRQGALLSRRMSYRQQLFSRIGEVFPNMSERATFGVVVWYAFACIVR